MQQTCPGFTFSGVGSDIKPNNQKDLGLIVCQKPATAAGMFTQNRVKAAPVILNQQRIQSGTARAIIVNSGNANCCNGKVGMSHALRMGQAVANVLGIEEELVLVSSTGVIGEPLPISKIESAAPALIEKLSENGVLDTARSMMTTDTVPKTEQVKGEINGEPYTLLGLIKGSGMIRPDMATMLCYILTDANIDQALLQKALHQAVSGTLNRLTIDGDTSTNDTALIMASGFSKAVVDSDDSFAIFCNSLEALLNSLSRQLVKDGEGVTKLVDIIVQGAHTDSDARQMADTIAHSNLVKTALFGEDANWGRIMAAAGRAGVDLNPERITLDFDTVRMVENGVGCGKDAENLASQVLKRDEFPITINLNLGSGCARVLTCDFSLDYVRINADYRS